MTEPAVPAAVPSITILTGAGRHTDPWHTLPATSSAIAATLTQLGTCAETTTAEVVSGCFADTDVLVVNASGDLAEQPPVSTDVVDAVHEYHESGGAVLAVHSSALAFRDDPRWTDLMGGRWVPGTSTHPQIGLAVVQVVPGAHPITAGLTDFVVYDERYAELEVHPSAELRAFHTEDGVTHPLVWAVDRTAAGRGRVVYDALGHGVESYDYPGRRALLLAAAHWLVESVDRPSGGDEW